MVIERHPSHPASALRAPEALRQARRALDGALSRDRGRLLGLLGRWQARPDDAARREAFYTALQASVNARAQRAATLPEAGTVDPALPIAAHADALVALIQAHQVVVVAGETGSGKTTQLPRLCLRAGRGAAGLIGCTQPRRLAARAVARRVAEELQVPLGGGVGYQVRFSDTVGEQTAIKFMTDGILLAEIQADRWLSKYDTLIIDEAHERSLNIDFLLGYLKQLLPRRPDLKLIVTSATIDTARFAAHFGDAPVVQVEGRGYPVEIRYRPLEGEADCDGERTVLDGIVAACDELLREPAGGDVLVFLPGEREIRDAHRALEQRRYRHVEILPLYARLSARDQDRVFHPGPQRRIVLATNVAETSLTVPRIHAVVDPGLARVKRYSPRQKLDRLHVEPISQASANQRAGRCGRTAPGICIRLYSEAEFAARPVYTDPEIRRASLAGVILRMLALGLGEIDRFPFLEPPDPRAIADGWQQLSELGAIDGQRRLTPIGKVMAKLPVDVKLARMLVAAQAHGVLADMLVIASFLGIQDPRERPADARGAADAAHAVFADPKSEFIGILKLWQAYHAAHEALTQSQLRKWAERHYLGFLRLREWWELHRQLKLQCQELGWECETATVLAGSDTASVDDKPRAQTAHAPYARLHRALIAGLPTQIGHRSDRGLYEGPRGRKFQLFPGSKLASRPPPWVLSATLLDTEKVWAITNAAIEPEWVIAELPHLLARRPHDPHWSRRQGRVVGSEQISLFGLVLAPKRPIHYGALFPEESREIFVRDALVTGEIDTRCGFLARNLRTLAQAREEEAKQRRVGLVVDEDWQARWYLDRLPPHVHNTQALEAWYKTLTPEQRAALEWTREDLLVADQSDAARFPAYLPLGDTRLAVRYRFAPGEPDDGMTIRVPLHLLGALDPARLSWLAPGFVEEKAAALIRSLPKSLRRNFVPVPEFARAFAEAYPDAQADSLEGTLARFLHNLTGVEIDATAFDLAALPVHLQANLQLVEGQTVLAESRDLDDLRARFGARAAAAFAQKAAQGLARSGLTTFPDTPVPVSVPGAGGVPAYPALEDRGDSVALVLHAQRETAERSHAKGVRRLLLLALADRRKQALKQLPVQPKLALLYAALGAPARDGQAQTDHLRADLVDGALSALTAEGLAEVRDAHAFEQRRDAIGKALFAEAMTRLRQAETILAQVAEVRARLEQPLLGWARANLDDMRAQLEALVPPGFLRSVPASALAEYPRYLKALALRAERGLRDPLRDQQRMLTLAPFQRALAEADPDDPNAQALRWELEELRVQLFAQELGVKGAISPKRLAARVEMLRRQ
ncbi:ATP-dependent RNA helicase HrpA [Thermomonas hydrothermalis]|uniref:ATP-dependent helicase HrpA n=1 Tax=Thermomonas hydrothermalis TaxID=213588 RepID=A0A1M4ZLG4_9GAMM|nr:ATP-dependent RNA helicase HrpA [Thermomonas hydrothermalis]SHF18795.1 ATP-dependent helicase HrpA [Thermomonas hydrothermalis]